MNAFSYKGAQMVLGEPDPLLSRNISDALGARGLKDLAICRDAESLRQAMVPMVDVVMCDVDLPGIDFCETAQDIRRSRAGSNPFAVLIATARPSAQADVGKVIKSGIDDFLIKPMTADLVIRRVGAFAEGRKPFVVTDAYVGPSRRTLRREDGSDDDLIQVPNTLRSRVIDNARIAELQEILESALSDVENKKIETRLKAITRLAQRLQHQLADHGRAGELRRILDLLAEKAVEVVNEHANSTTPHVSELAVRIAKVARRAGTIQARPSQVEVNLLLKLSDALVSSFTASAAAQEIAGKISGIVDKYLGSE
ncbi:MAG TPA: response regulator [Magnetospirillaceae bacterium]|jgi:DNA-binding response OmpR family regulator